MSTLSIKPILCAADIHTGAIHRYPQPHREGYAFHWKQNNRWMHILTAKNYLEFFDAELQYRAQNLRYPWRIVDIQSGIVIKTNERIPYQGTSWVWDEEVLSMALPWKQASAL